MNWKHIVPSTHAENCTDERGKRGKLTDETAAEALRRMRDGEKPSQIHADYGVQIGAMYVLRARKTFAHLQEPS